MLAFAAAQPAIAVSSGGAITKSRLSIATQPSPFSISSPRSGGVSARCSAAVSIAVSSRSGCVLALSPRPCLRPPRHHRRGVLSLAARQIHHQRVGATLLRQRLLHRGDVEEGEERQALIGGQAETPQPAIGHHARHFDAQLAHHVAGLARAVERLARRVAGPLDGDQDRVAGGHLELRRQRLVDDDAG